MSLYKNIAIKSDLSKQVLKLIVENKEINYTDLGLNKIKNKILDLKKEYQKEKDNNKNKKNFKYEIFWNLVEKKYNKKINVVKRSQKKKETKVNIIYSDFANVLGFLPSLLSLLIFDKEIQNLIQYESFFKNLQSSGDFNNIGSEQKLSFIKKIQKGKITIVTPLCPDYEYVYVGLGLYKYTFNKLNDELGLIGKRLSKIINNVHLVLKKNNISFNHKAYYGDFEAYSKDICKRVGETEKQFTKKLLLSSKNLKRSIKSIDHVGLLVAELSDKKKWFLKCKKNEKKIYEVIDSNRNLRKYINEILNSRMDLYKSWYPNLSEKKYLDLLIKQGSEYATMGDIFFEKLKNPVVFGLDHPKMGIFYNINVDIPIFYGKPKYI